MVKYFNLSLTVVFRSKIFIFKKYIIFNNYMTENSRGNEYFYYYSTAFLKSKLISIYYNISINFHLI